MSLTWYSTDSGGAQQRLLGVWPEAPIEQLELTAMLLEVAKGDVLECAPDPAAGQDYETAPPTRFVLAQLRQAQALWDAGRVDSDGNIGEGTFTFTPRPLDKAIRKTIRPANGKPHVL